VSVLTNDPLPTALTTVSGNVVLSGRSVVCCRC